MKATRPRANGRAAAFAPAIASRPATSASIRGSYCAWRGPPWSAPKRRHGAAKKGVEGFRHVAHDVNIFENPARRRPVGAAGAGGQAASHRRARRSRFRLLYRLQRAQDAAIALLALDIMDALGISYEVMGGPTHCCGVPQLRAGDSRPSAASPRARSTSWRRARPGRSFPGARPVTSSSPKRRCRPSSKTRGAKPFEMTPFTLFVRRHLDRLRPLLRQPVPMRIALHKHPGVRGVVAAAEDILRGGARRRTVDLAQPAVGLQANDLNRCRPIAARCRGRAQGRGNRRRRRAGRASIIPTTASSAPTSATFRSTFSICTRSSALSMGT